MKPESLRLALDGGANHAARLASIPTLDGAPGTVNTGVRPSGEGWCVVNAREVPWFETDGCGFYAVFEPEDARFSQVGVGVGVLRPGEPALYTTERMPRRTSSWSPVSACF